MHIYEIDRFFFENVNNTRELIYSDETLYSIYDYTKEYRKYSNHLFSLFLLSCLLGFLLCSSKQPKQKYIKYVPIKNIEEIEKDKTAPTLVKGEIV